MASILNPSSLLGVKFCFMKLLKSKRGYFIISILYPVRDTTSVLFQMSVFNSLKPLLTLKKFFSGLLSR